MLRLGRAHFRPARCSLGTAASSQPTPIDFPSSCGKKHAHFQNAAIYFSPVMLGCILRRGTGKVHPGIVSARQVFVLASDPPQPNISAEANTENYEEDTGSWFASCIGVIGSGALLSKVLLSQVLQTTQHPHRLSVILHITVWLRQRRFSGC